MNREELLDKLAMELGEWPDGTRAGLEAAKSVTPYASAVNGWPVCTIELGDQKIHKNAWQARRAELINKPSWDSAPEWAEWLAQDGDGEWAWFEDRPYLERDHALWISKAHSCGSSDGTIPANHDWRQTLEPRPDEWQQGEERIDRIAQSDGSGEHYAEAESSLMDDDLMACIDSQRHLHAALQAWEEDERVGAGTPAGEPEQFTAAGILTAGRGHMRERAATYDKPQGERSMSATVKAFQATTGIEMTEEQGWHFMALLKLVRSQQGALRMDSYEDGAAYIALAGEAAAKSRQ